jgi:hypothetical protein
MINVPLNKILFLDIETVGIQPNFDTLVEKNEALAYQFENYFDWFQKKFAEDKAKDFSEMFVNKSALVSEFAKIVCISMAFVNEDGSIKMQSFSGKDELDILKKTQAVLRKVGALNYFLCGHNVKGFDIPMLAKRMMINGLLPPKMLPSYDTKPWEVKAIDTKDIWQYGSFGSIASLELMCISLGIESPKNMDVTGNKVHNAYWIDDNIDGITKYCERDVEVLIDVIKKLMELS